MDASDRRRVDPDAVNRLCGKYKHLGGPTVDEDRAAARAEDAEAEDRWMVARGLHRPEGR